MKYPWTIGDLIRYYENPLTSFASQEGKNGVIIEINDKGGLETFTVLVNGRTKICLENQLAVPKVNKIKSTFSIKK